MTKIKITHSTPLIYTPPIILIPLIAQPYDVNLGLTSSQYWPAKLQEMHQ